jgi:hypothetical protein
MMESLMKKKTLAIMINIILFSISPAFAMEDESLEENEHASPQLSPKRKVSKTIPLNRRRKSSGSSKIFSKSMSPPLTNGTITPRDEKISPRRDRFLLTSVGITPREDKISPREDRISPRENRSLLTSGTITPREDKISPREDRISPRENRFLLTSGTITPREDKISPRKDRSLSTSVAITPREEKISPRENRPPSPVDERKVLLIGSSTISPVGWEMKPGTRTGTRKFSLEKSDAEVWMDIKKHVSNSNQEKTKELLEHPGDSSKEEFSERDISPIRQRKEPILTEEDSLGREDSLRRPGSITPQRERKLQVENFSLQNK